MKLFDGKPQKNGPAGAERRGSSDGGEGGGPRPSHRLTLDLSRAEQLAAMLAQSRAAKFVEVADLLAGMYIYEWDRLSRFWEDHEEVERLLQQMCNISPQRWHHWIELYDRQRRDGEKEEASPLRGLRKKPEDAEAPGRSTELQNLFKTAEQISPFLDRVDGENVPVLTTECVLLCIARHEHSDLSRKLRDTGLDLEALELAARNPRRSPPR
ncbi:MAG TPA: hypothetical protein VLY23_01000 [Candidatus Acidoferrum sp.]|nr:hypothetical protein [Candidatus Acidoferrum sp.]